MRSLKTGMKACQIEEAKFDHHTAALDNSVSSYLQLLVIQLEIK